MKKLVADGRIKRYTIEIDPTKIGYPIMNPIPNGSLSSLNETCIEDSRKAVVFPNMCRLMRCLYSLGVLRFRI